MYCTEINDRVKITWTHFEDCLGHYKNISNTVQKDQIQREIKFNALIIRDGVEIDFCDEQLTFKQGQFVNMNRDLPPAAIKNKCTASKSTEIITCTKILSKAKHSLCWLTAALIYHASCLYAESSV